MLKQLLVSAALMFSMAASAVTLNMGDQFGSTNIDNISAWTQEGFTLTPSAGQNVKGKVPCYKSKNQEVRIYALNTLTIDAPEGKIISAISFSLSKQGKEEQAVVTPSVGEIEPQTVNGAIVSWTGSASSVTFTVGETNSLHPDGIADGSGQLDFTEIAITTEDDEPEMPSDGIEINMGEYFGQANIDAISDWTQDGYTFIPSIGSNAKGKVPCYKSKNQEVRFYALNTLTIKAPANTNIKAITFNLSKQGVEEQAVISSDCGTIENQTVGSKTVSWSGAASEITFTVGETNALHPEGIVDGSGQLDFTSLIIVSENGSATIISVVAQDSNSTDKTYYNLSGIEVKNPTNGIFICKQGNKVSKIILR